MALTRYNYWMPSMGGQTAAMDAALETPARGSYTSGSRASGQERTGAGKTPAPFDAAASGVSSGPEDRGRHTVPEPPRPLAGGGCCVGRATRHSHQRYDAREKPAPASHTAMERIILFAISIAPFFSSIFHC